MMHFPLDLIRDKRSVCHFIHMYTIKAKCVNYRRAFWVHNSLVFFLRAVRIRLFRAVRLTSLHLFTKPRNHNKLYVTGSQRIFLSPGIVLRFLTLHNKRALRKKKRVWVGAVKALRILVRRPVVLWFDNLFGKRMTLFERLLGRRFIKAWIFIRLFYLNYAPDSRGRRRIKRWLRKRYYQLGVGENK